MTLKAALTLLMLAPAFAQDEPKKEEAPKKKEYEGGKIDWVRDPAVGLARARLEGRAAMLYFTADW